MWISAIVAYLHYLGFMLSFAALGIELFYLKPDFKLEEAKKVAFADIVYGISAVMILVTGILRVMYFGKGTEYYLNNPFFYIKIGIFIIVGLLSLYPTITFIFWFKDFLKEETPKLEENKINLLSWLIKGEIAGFILIPLLAAIMARINRFS
jgi:putative membrane protein